MRVFTRKSMRLELIIQLFALVASLMAVTPTFGEGETIMTVDELNQLRAQDTEAAGQPTVMTMAPAEWIWLPCQRTLSNTFVLFRKELDLPEKPVRAMGWISADSRYQLSARWDG